MEYKEKKMKEYGSVTENNQENGTGSAEKRSPSKNIPEFQSDARLSDMVHVRNFLHVVCKEFSEEEQEESLKRFIARLGI